MRGFTFAGIHSTNQHLHLLKSRVSVLPGTRDKVIPLLGRHGAVRLIPDLGERIMQLECWLQASSVIELHNRLDRVRAWFNPLLGAQRLIFDSVPDRYYMAAYAGNGLETGVTARQGRFTIELVCSDPFAYEVSPDAIAVTTSPYPHTQRGTAPADPLFRLYGSSLGSWQRLSLEVGPQIVTYSGPLAAGDWLEIDCAAKTAVRVLGGVRTNVMPHLARPVFPQLAPGANVVRVLAEGGAQWTLLEIDCRNRWL